MPTAPKASPAPSNVVPLHDPARDAQRAALELREALELLDRAQADVSRALRGIRGREGEIDARLLALAVGSLRCRARVVAADAEILARALLGEGEGEGR